MNRHRPYYLVDGRVVDGVNPDPSGLTEVNGIKVGSYCGGCLFGLVRSDIAKARKPGVWQISYSASARRAMIYYTCPWCGHLGSTGDLERGPFCVVCDRCWRHYWIELLGWMGASNEILRARQEAAKEGNHDGTGQ